MINVADRFRLVQSLLPRCNLRLPKWLIFWSFYWKDLSVVSILFDVLVFVDIDGFRINTMTVFWMNSAVIGRRLFTICVRERSLTCMKATSQTVIEFLGRRRFISEVISRFHLFVYILCFVVFSLLIFTIHRFFIWIFQGHVLLSEIDVVNSEELIHPKIHTLSHPSHSIRPSCDSRITW